MSKPVMEQRDRFNQRLTLHLELENGERAQPGIYLSRLLRTQSLEDWNGRPEEFQKWIADAMTEYWKRVQVKIWGHSKTTEDKFSWKAGDVTVRPSTPEENDQADRNVKGA